MTAKTVLVQMHHKVETLEHIGKRLVLVVQNHLLEYLRRQFDFGHLVDARLGDAMQFHAYRLNEGENGFRLELAERVSTDAAGVARCLGIQGGARVELDTILAELERRISANTLLTLDAKPLAARREMPAE